MSELLPLETVTKSKRLTILTSAEIEDLYALPQLTEEERVNVFELTKQEQIILSSNISLASKVDTIIRLGYFKQKQQFFQFDLKDVPDDVNHVVERYFSTSLLDKRVISHVTKINDQKWVLQITGYKLFDHGHHFPILLEKATKLCRLSVNPVFIFRELFDEITQRKITRPGYSTFQKIISIALVSEQNRISQIFKEHLSQEEKNQVFHLLNQEEKFYAVTLLKQQPKNFKPTAIRQEIEYYEQYQHLYKIAKRLLPILDISKNGVAYYASLVEHYTVRALIRTNHDQTCLWLLCFIYHRCQRMLDNLGTMFIYIANQYHDDVIKQAEALLLIHSL